MTKDKALDLALEALGLYQAAGFGNSTDFNKQHEAFYKAQTAIIAIKQARALDKKAENARELGLDYEPAPGYCQQCKQYSIEEPLPAQPAPVQEPEYWDVIDPAGNIVASETDAIRGWARIAGSYKPTVEGLLGFHDQGWRVLPKVTPPAAQRQWVGLTDEEILKLAYPIRWQEVDDFEADKAVNFAQIVEAKLKEMNI